MSCIMAMVRPTADKNAIITNNFGKIVLKKGLALSALRVLKTDGAMTDVWKTIAPQIKPDNKIKRSERTDMLSIYTDHWDIY